MKIKAQVETMMYFDYFLKGVFPEDLGLKELDYDVVQYSIIKYPEALDYFKKVKESCVGSFARDLARIVHYCEPPLGNNHEVIITIPIDCLPIPPKHIVESLDSSWDFFKTAWAILGDYDIPNLSIYRDHRELAYRNNKSWESLKINAFQDNEDAMIKLGEREILDDPRLERVFEMFWDKRRECPPEITGLMAFVDWNKKLHNEFNVKDSGTTYIPEKRFMPKVIINRSYKVHDRPWQRVFYRKRDQEYITPEAKEWLDIQDKPCLRTDVLEEEVLAKALAKEPKEISLLLERSLNNKTENLSLLERKVLLIVALIYDNMLSQSQLAKIRDKYGELDECDREEVLENKDDLIRQSDYFGIHCLCGILDDGEINFVIPEHRARKYGMYIHKDSPLIPDFFIKDMEKLGCLSEREDSIIAKIWNYHGDKLATILTKE